jgi:hypothetical protein
MEEIIKILLVIVFSGLTLMALLAVITLLLPEPVQRTRQYVETALGRSLLLGLVNTLFAGVIVLVFLWLTQQTGGLLAGIFLLIAGISVLALVALLLLGLCALSGLLGSRMSENGTPFARSMRGAFLLLLAGLAPYIGWFVFTPLILLLSVGAGVQVVLQRRPKTVEPPVTA